MGKCQNEPFVPQKPNLTHLTTKLAPSSITMVSSWYVANPTIPAGLSLAGMAMLAALGLLILPPLFTVDSDTV